MILNFLPNKSLHCIMVRCIWWTMVTRKIFTGWWTLSWIFSSWNFFAILMLIFAIFLIRLIGLNFPIIFIGKFFNIILSWNLCLTMVTRKQSVTFTCSRLPTGISILYKIAIVAKLPLEAFWIKQSRFGWKIMQMQRIPNTKVFPWIPFLEDVWNVSLYHQTTSCLSAYLNRGLQSFNCHVWQWYLNWK